MIKVGQIYKGYRFSLFVYNKTTNNTWIVDGVGFAWSLTDKPPFLSNRKLLTDIFLCIE